MSIFKKILFLFFLNFFFPQADASDKIFQNILKLKQQGKKVSLLIQRLDDGEILYEISPDLHLIPASTTKIGLASLALETWGPQKTFTTKFLARGDFKNGVIHGDLIFYGGGDPGFLNENMADIQTEIDKIGLKKITGRLIVNNSMFGKLRPDKSRLSGKKYSQHAYDAPLSAASINYSVLGISVRPGQKVNAKAKIQIDPFDIPSAKIINRVKTTKSGTRTSVLVERRSDQDKDYYIVSGNIALNDKEHKIYRSVSNPDRYAGETLVAYLNSFGVTLNTSSIKVENTPLQKTDQVIFEVSGSTLETHLKGLLTYSNNFIADMLLLDLNLKNSKNLQQKNVFTIQDQSQILEEYFKNLTNDAHIVIKSGSGLTPQNRLSAHNLATVLREIYLKKSSFKIFLNSLTTPGEIGTLQHRFNQLSFIDKKTLLYAKTGTLSSPCDAVSLAGYAKNLNNEWLGFAIIVNGENNEKSSSVFAIQQAIDKDMSLFLKMGKQHS